MQDIHPPKLPLKLLRWFCTEERLEEVEGDLYEIWWEQRLQSVESQLALLVAGIPEFAPLCFEKE